MEHELTFRPLKEEDYKIICEWWRWWMGIVVDKDFLPENGVGGYIIEKNKEPIACGFTYETNSKVTWLAWVTSNPGYKQEDRGFIIKSLIENIEKVCKQNGYEYVFTACQNKHLIKMHEELGWSNNKNPSYEIIKKL
tara:strand:+ start:352 stop:762 length:411 start_codon:yes stop_codon:yes gene_type:complete